MKRAARVRRTGGDFACCPNRKAPVRSPNAFCANWINRNEVGGAFPPGRLSQELPSGWAACWPAASGRKRTMLRRNAQDGTRLPQSWSGPQVYGAGTDAQAQSSARSLKFDEQRFEIPRAVSGLCGGLVADPLELPLDERSVTGISKRPALENSRGRLRCFERLDLTMACVAGNAPAQGGYAGMWPFEKLREALARPDERACHIERAISWARRIHDRLHRFARLVSIQRADACI